jgi:hypothetical protein
VEQSLDKNLLYRDIFPFYWAKNLLYWEIFLFYRQKKETHSPVFRVFSLLFVLFSRLIPLNDAEWGRNGRFTDFLSINLQTIPLFKGEWISVVNQRHCKGDFYYNDYNPYFKRKPP